MFGQQAEDLDATYHKGHHNRDERDGEVVAKFAHRLDEGPAISSEHKDVVGSVDSDNSV